MTKPMTGTLNEYRVTYMDDDEMGGECEYLFETFDLAAAQLKAREYDVPVEQRQVEMREDGQAYSGEWKVRV